MIEYYELVKRTHEPGEIETAAMWSCALCGEAIAGMGGPGNGEICVSCGDALKVGMKDRLRRRVT